MTLCCEKLIAAMEAATVNSPNKPRENVSLLLPTAGDSAPEEMDIRTLNFTIRLMQLHPQSRAMLMLARLRWTLRTAAESLLRR